MNINEYEKLGFTQTPHSKRLSVMSPGAHKAVIFGAFVLIFFLLMAIPYNNLLELSQNVATKRSGLEVAMQQRGALVSPFLNLAYTYAKKDNHIILSLVSSQKRVQNAFNLKEKLAANYTLSNNLAELQFFLQKYQELKTDQRFMDLHIKLLAANKNLSQAKNRFNQAVMEYNETIEGFPISFLAGLLGFDHMPVFEDHFFSQALP